MARPVGKGKGRSGEEVHVLRGGSEGAQEGKKNIVSSPDGAVGLHEKDN